MIDRLTLAATLTGPDRPGITAALMSAVAGLGTEVLDLEHRQLPRLGAAIGDACRGTVAGFMAPHPDRGRQDVGVSTAPPYRRSRSA